MADDNNNDNKTSNDNHEDSNREGSADKLRADLADERKSRQALQATNKSLESRLAELEAQSQTETEKAIAAAQKKAADEATQAAEQRLNQRVVRTEVRRLAAEKFADVSDPLGALDLSSIEVDADGNVDEKAINKELDALLKQKPHWAKAAGGTKGSGSADQGARGSGASGGVSMNDLIRRGVGRK